MGRRTGANIVRNNMHKVNRMHSDKEMARSMLRNHELTAQQFYLEKKPETDCQETLDAIRFAHDRLGLKEIDEDFSFKAALKNARQENPSLPKKDTAILDASSDDDNLQLSSFLNTTSTTTTLSSNNTSTNSLPNFNKNQLTFLAMKANLEYQKMLMQTIQQL